MSITTKIKNILEHPLVDTIATLIKKFKSSKSYWSVSFLVILFTLREAIVWKYGSAISAYAQKQLVGSDWSWLWTAIEFVFDIGGSWQLALGGFIIFIILSLVEVSKGKSNTITLKESFLSLLLLLTIFGMTIYAVSSNNTNHTKTHKQQEITHNKLDEIKALIKLQDGDETDFLIKYFGKDYKVILNHPQTYHNFTTLLKKSKKTADKLLKEREELLKKIKTQSFNKTFQNQIDKAFRELRYEDVRELIDGFLEANADKEKEIIKAHYIKALSFIEEIRYHEAKAEFEKIAPNIDDAKILNDYGRIYYILGEYDKAIEYYEKTLKIILSTLGENHPNTAIVYNNIGLVLYSDGKYDTAMEQYEKSLKIKLINLEEIHPDTAVVHNNIGLVWFKKEKYDKAMEYFEKDLNISLVTREKNHPSIATAYNNIGVVLNIKGEYDKAIKYHEKSLNIRLFTLGYMHPDTAISYKNIGSVWDSKGEYDKAIEYYEKALHTLYGVFPKGHPNIDVIEGNLYSAKESLKNETK